MSNRLTAIIIGLLALTACASASPDEASAPSSNVAAAAQAPIENAPPPAADNAGTASNVTVPVAPPPRRTSDDDVVVPGVQDRPVTPPRGDTRSVSERMADVRAWDTCVMRAQGQSSGDPMRPQLDSPEDVCRRHLGMSNRNAIPDSRRP